MEPQQFNSKLLPNRYDRATSRENFNHLLSFSVSNLYRYHTCPRTFRDTIHGSPIVQSLKHGGYQSGESIALGWLVLWNVMWNVNSCCHIRHKSVDRKADQNNYDRLNGWNKAVADEAGEGMALIA